jgi:glycoside hydrolase-like protein
VAQVLDYSAGLPGGSAIKRAGYIGAVRYIGFPDRRKCTSRGEYEDFSRNGLHMALVYQDGTGDAFTGRQGGVAAAVRARAHADQIGFPRSRPIYFAVDRDVVTAGEFAAAMAYLDGAASVLGIDQVGVYGEADIVDMALPGHARYGWQTAAWSRSRRTNEAHLFQRIGLVTVGGIGCDINEVLQADWGQHTYVEDEMSSVDAYNGFAQLLKDVDGGQAEDLKAILDRIIRGSAYNAIADLLKDLDAGEANDLLAIAHRLWGPGGGSPEQMQHLGEQLRRLADILDSGGIPSKTVDEFDRRNAVRANTTVPPA